MNVKPLRSWRVTELLVCAIAVPFGPAILLGIGLRDLWTWIRTEPDNPGLAARMRREECRLGALADLPEPRGMVQEKKRRFAAIGPRTSSYDREVSR